MKMGLVVDNKLYGLNPLDILRWDFLSFKEKTDLALFYLKITLGVKKPKKGESVYIWLKRNKLSKNIITKILEPVIKEKYNIGLKESSAEELYYRLKKSEARSRILYPKKGLHEMFVRLEKRLERKGVEIRKDEEVKRMIVDRNKITIYTKNEKINVHKVINSAPIPVFLKMTKGIPSFWRSKLSRIKYCKNINVDIITEEKITDFYWINIFGKYIGGLINHTFINKLPFNFYWVWKYCPKDEIFRMKNEKIFKLYKSELERHFPEIHVKDFFVFKEKYASPVYDKNYYKFMPSVETPVKNIFFTGISTTYPGIRDMNNAIKSGIDTAKIVNARD